MAHGTTAGSLYYSFAFSKREIVSDDMGNEVGQWVEKFRTRAALSYRQGNEAVIASRLEGKKPAFLTIRRFASSSEVTTSWMCTDVRTGQTYNIRSIEPDTYNRQYLRMTLEGGVAEG